MGERDADQVDRDPRLPVDLERVLRDIQDCVEVIEGFDYRSYEDLEE